MKKTVSLLLAAALLLGLLSACKKEEDVSGRSSSPSPPEEANWTAANLSEIAFQFSGFDPSDEFEHLYLDKDRESLSVYIENAYEIEGWLDAAVSRGTGASAFEIAILRMEDEGAAVRAASSLMSYMSDRQGDFVGYAPDQADLVANGSLFQSGPWVGLFICPDPDRAERAVRKALDGEGADIIIWDEPAPDEPSQPAMDSSHPDRYDFTPPNEDDMSLYDTSAILAAWESDNPSGLSDYDRDIYDAAKKVLNDILGDGMSDYEKEEAIYGWIADRVDYDWTHQNRLKRTPRESFTPYGGLVNHTAVCLGYATTFQLLCDLAGVECITVVGAAFESREDHGWNMVRLDGNWYCVDVTWDANYRELGSSSGPEDWSFFNVTSDYMALSDHQWDYANTPEAVTEDSGKD